MNSKMGRITVSSASNYGFFCSVAKRAEENNASRMGASAR